MNQRGIEIIVIEEPISSFSISAVDNCKHTRDICALSIPSSTLFLVLSTSSVGFLNANKEGLHAIPRARDLWIRTIHAAPLHVLSARLSNYYLWEAVVGAHPIVLFLYHCGPFANAWKIEGPSGKGVNL